MNLKVTRRQAAGSRKPEPVASSCSHFMRLCPLAAGALLAALAGTGCGHLPRDPEHTLERVMQQKRLRVGLVENPPWVMHGEDGPRGAEITMVRRFAESLGAAPEWFWGSEGVHMKALRDFALDLVIGGIDSSTPWAKTIGMTRPYFTERIVVAVPAGVAPPDSLKGQHVSVLGSEVAFASLEKKGATPILAATGQPQVSGPVAAPDWQLRQLGVTPTKFELLSLKHVLLVPPGENGWLKRLQEFLASQAAEVPVLLRQNGGAR